MPVKGEFNFRRFVHTLTVVDQGIAHQMIAHRLPGSQANSRNSTIVLNRGGSTMA